MGLGRQIAISLAKQGCNVAIADIDLESAQKTADDLVKYRVKSKAYKIDVSSLTHIVRLKLDIRKDFGEVDIIVNNAGLMPVATVSQAKMRTIEKTIDVNLISHLLVRNFDGLFSFHKGFIELFACTRIHSTFV